MAITLWRRTTPFEGISHWLSDLESWFDDEQLSTLEGIWRPQIDIEEKDGGYLLKADLPGMDKKDIHVELEKGYLTIKGHRANQKEQKGEHYYRHERSFGCFQRSFKVPDGVTEKDITAKYHDGVLELSIPAPKVETPKAVEVPVK